MKPANQCACGAFISDRAVECVSCAKRRASALGLAKRRVDAAEARESAAHEERLAAFRPPWVTDPALLPKAPPSRKGGA